MKPRPTSTRRFSWIRLLYAVTYVSRGDAWSDKGEYAKAFADFNAAIQLDPSNAHAYSSLASLQTTCPDEKYRDGKKAVENANIAYQLTEGRNWMFIEVLAEAYAESGEL